MNDKQTVINIEYEPHKYQLEIHKDPSRFKVLVCGRRFGKTILAVNEIIIRALQNPGTKNWYIGPTYRQCKEIAWGPLLHYLPRQLIKKKDEGDLSVTLIQGSTIALRGAENEDSLRGSGLNFVVLDEYREIKPNVWTDIIRPTLLDTKGEAIFISTAAENHLKELFDWANTAEAKEQGWKTWRFPSDYNLSRPHIKEELQVIKREYEQKGQLDAYEREYQAEWRPQTGAIYPEFSRDVHVLTPDKYPSLNSNYAYYRAVDFGTDNPTAILYIAVDYDDTIYVFDEFVRRGLSINQIVWGLNRYPDKHFITTYYDAAAKILDVELRQRGIVVSPSTKGADSVTTGISKVKNKLARSPYTGKPKLYVYDRCKTLIEEFAKYRWRENRSEVSDKDQPIKKDDHCLDALRYFILTHYDESGKKKWRPPRQKFYETTAVGSFYR